MLQTPAFADNLRRIVTFHAPESFFSTLRALQAESEIIITPQFGWFSFREADAWDVFYEEDSFMYSVPELAQKSDSCCQ